MADSETLPAVPKGYENWAKKLKTAASRYKTSLWEIGDLLNEGEASYGEMYAQAADETGLGKQTLMNTKWVANAIPVELRQEGLSFSLHKEVAGLEHKYQKPILGLAVDLEWGSKEVKIRVKAVSEGDEKALLPEWTKERPSSPEESSPEESADEEETEDPPVSSDSSADDESPRSQRPNLSSRAEYIAFHASELVGLMDGTTPAMIVDDLEGAQLDQFFVNADEVVFWLGGVAAHKP